MSVCKCCGPICPRRRLMWRADRGSVALMNKIDRILHNYAFNVKVVVESRSLYTFKRKWPWRCMQNGSYRVLLSEVVDAGRGRTEVVGRWNCTRTYGNSCFKG